MSFNHILGFSMEGKKTVTRKCVFNFLAQLRKYVFQTVYIKFQEPSSGVDEEAERLNK